MTVVRSKSGEGRDGTVKVGKDGRRHRGRVGDAASWSEGDAAGGSEGEGRGGRRRQLGGDNVGGGGSGGICETDDGRGG